MSLPIICTSCDLHVIENHHLRAELAALRAERDALKAEQTEWRRKMSAALYEAEPARATLAQEVER